MGSPLSTPSEGGYEGGHSRTPTTLSAPTVVPTVSVHTPNALAEIPVIASPIPPAISSTTGRSTKPPLAPAVDLLKKFEKLVLFVFLMLEEEHRSCIDISSGNLLYFATLDEIASLHHDHHTEGTVLCSFGRTVETKVVSVGHRSRCDES